MDSHPEPPSKLNNIPTQISRIEDAFGTPNDSIAENVDPEALARAEERKTQVVKAREEFIKLYQPAAMSYIRGVLVRIANGTPGLSDDVGAVWSNLVTRLLQGNFTSFKHKGQEGSFRCWLRRVVANECKQHLQKSGRILGARGPKNAVALGENYEAETYDPEDRTLEDVLRKTVIDRAYDAMEDDGLYGVAVLFAAERGGDFSSEELAQHLSKKSEKTISVAAAKKRLQRGRELFAQTLLEQVAKLDGTEDLDRIEETLIELDLMSNCRKALDALRSSRR